MKPFMGFSKLFSARNLPSSEKSRRSRRVKIDFLQNGEELPEGTVESISAGGGKAPGHHEGGGLTVKVNPELPAQKKQPANSKEAEKEVRSGTTASGVSAKPRKTLNFYFTW